MKRNKGWDKTESQKKKISETLKRIGHRPPVIMGHPCYYLPLKDKNGVWKDDEVGYFALRTWLTRNYGKPDKCDNPDCKYPRKNYDGELMIAPKRYEWMYIGQPNAINKRRKELWKTYCPSCHRKIYKTKV